MEEKKKNRKKLWLEKFNAFTLSGNDIQRFLNGITTSNLLGANNKVIKTCWLTPNGILRSLLEISCSDNKFEVIILEGDVNEIKEYFQDIIFPLDDVLVSETSSKYRIQEVDEFSSWRIYTPIVLDPNDQKYNFYKNNPQVMSNSELKEWKINQAIPGFKNEINGKNNPLELGLADLVDFNKGCYLGQETMAKLKNVTSLKQEIRVWTSNQLMPNLKLINKNIYNNNNKEKAVGYITSFYKLKSKRYKGLAIIKRKYLEANSCFFSEDFGIISLDKSAGSVFM